MPGGEIFFFAFVFLLIQRWDIEGLRALEARRLAEDDEAVFSID